MSITTVSSEHCTRAASSMLPNMPVITSRSGNEAISIFGRSIFLSPSGPNGAHLGDECVQLRHMIEIKRL